MKNMYKEKRFGFEDLNPIKIVIERKIKKKDEALIKTISQSLYKFNFPNFRKEFCPNFISITRKICEIMEIKKSFEDYPEEICNLFSQIDKIFCENKFKINKIQQGFQTDVLLRVDRKINISQNDIHETQKAFEILTRVLNVLLVNLQKKIISV